MQTDYSKSKRSSGPELAHIFCDTGSWRITDIELFCMNENESEF